MTKRLQNRGIDMSTNTINIAEAKKHLSEILGRVAYGKEQIVITKRGKPMARLVPMETKDSHLADAKGWLEETDEFFTVIERVISDRQKHVPRALCQYDER